MTSASSSNIQSYKLTSMTVMRSLSTKQTSVRYGNNVSCMLMYVLMDGSYHIELSAEHAHFAKEWIVSRSTERKMSACSRK